MSGMLVLSRQRDEIVNIGDDVEITVVDIRGDKVRLGITAPKHIPVHRKEVHEAIKRERRANAEPGDVSAAKPTIETHHMTRMGKKPTRGGL